MLDDKLPVKQAKPLAAFQAFRNACQGRQPREERARHRFQERRRALQHGRVERRLALHVHLALRRDFGLARMHGKRRRCARHRALCNARREDAGPHNPYARRPILALNAAEVRHKRCRRVRRALNGGRKERQQVRALSVALVAALLVREGKEGA